METNVVARRSALVQLACFGGLLAAAAALPACVAEAADDADDVGNGEDELRSCAAVGATIGTNHGHALTVPPADVTAGVAKTYTLSGSHAHQVSLTAANFATLKTKGKVVVASTTALGHAHSVTVSCTGPVVSPPAARCKSGISAAQISANHGHALAVPAADIASGVAKSYSIQGASGHDHRVSLTAADFASLKTGASLTVTATTGAGHTHTVTVRCA
ncbi:MAG: hypothetical protein HOO96_35890 [Polyangiaceae bacterium]|nr:hypothetical protein [Polyangiaceae bacterium]